MFSCRPHSPNAKKRKKERKKKKDLQADCAPFYIGFCVQGANKPDRKPGNVSPYIRPNKKKYQEMKSG